MSALSGTVDVPGVGGVDKRVVLGVGGAIVVFIGWKWYASRGAAAYDPATDAAVDPGFEGDGGELPSVAGAVSPTNSYGSADASGSTGTDAYGFHGTTNSEWSQYATTQLSQASDTWSYGTIVTALGAFIANKPLTTVQQQIVQAAIAVAGYPPEGSHVIVSGGDTAITVAPAGVKVTAITETTASLSWNPVAGADGYRLYRSGMSQVAGASHGAAGVIGGLTPNTSYTFQVAAFTGSGQVGPKSAAVKGKTKAVKLGKPTIRVSSVAGTAATVSWSKVSGATSYRIFVNGVPHGTADGGLSSYRITRLSKKTRYTVTVRADTTTQAPGPESNKAVFTTKSK